MEAVNTRWNEAVSVLVTLHARYHGPQTQELERGIAKLFKYKSWPGCVFSMMTNPATLEELTPLGFLEEHFAFMEALHGLEDRPRYEHVHKFIGQWQREWRAFTNSRFFRLRMPCELNGTGREIRSMYTALEEMNTCLEYKLNPDVLSAAYMDLYWSDDDKASVKTAGSLYFGSGSSATLSDDELEEQDLEGFDRARLLEGLLEDEPGRGGGDGSHNTRACAMITDALVSIFQGQSTLE